MKRFLVKCSLFLLAAVSSVVLFWLLLSIPRAGICCTDATMLICGNSTVEFGVDDSRVPRSLNMGFNAEHIEYIYAKIKMMKAANPALDTVLLAIDDGLLQKDVSSAYSSELHHFYYYDQFALSDIYNTARLSSFDWMSQYFARPFKPQQIYNVLRNAGGGGRGACSLGIGGYEHLDTDNLAVDIAKRGSLQAEHDTAVPELSAYYLDRISGFCRDNDMTLILFTTPQYPIARRYAYRDFLATAHPELPLLDFTDYDLPDSLYSDCGHLNTRGAAVFGTILADALGR